MCIKILSRSPHSHMPMGPTLSSVSLDLDGTCFSSFMVYSGLSSRTLLTPLPQSLNYRLLRQSWFFPATCKYSLGVALRQILHTAGQLLEVSKKQMLVPPSFAWFRIMGNPTFAPWETWELRKMWLCHPAISWHFFLQWYRMCPEIQDFNKYPMRK